MIKVKNLKRCFFTGKEPFWALKGVDLEINDGEFVAICGKSGSGKSTLLNLIGSLDKATEGEIWLDDYDISTLSQKKLAIIRNKMIGFVFQSFYLEPGYTVYDNVELPLILSGSTGSVNRKKVEKALELVNLSNKIKAKANTLSGGEQQRVAIARAIINDPKYIFADEPCGNLDNVNSENIMNILKKLHENGKTIVMVTHDLEDAKKAERIFTMSDGLIINNEVNQ